MQFNYSFLFLTLIKTCVFLAEGRTSFELRESFVLPEDASQSMQAFKSKLMQPISREGSKSKISSLRRESSNSKLGTPVISRKKSDLDREGRSIPSFVTKDYSGVKSHGYGITHNTPKKKRDIPESVIRTPSQPKISREKSGDVYKRLYGTSASKSVKTSTASPKTPTTVPKTGSKTTSATRVEPTTESVKTPISTPKAGLSVKKAANKVANPTVNDPDSKIASGASSSEISIEKSKPVKKSISGASQAPKSSSSGVFDRLSASKTSSVKQDEGEIAVKSGIPKKNETTNKSKLPIKK